MLGFDNKVVENYRKIMQSYMRKCKDDTKAGFLYEYETTIRYNGVPVAKVVYNGSEEQVLPVGEKKK